MSWIVVFVSLASGAPPEVLPPQAGEIWGRVFSGIMKLNDPLDPMSTLNSVNEIVGGFTPEENQPGCEHGKLRFNGDCIVEEKYQPVFDRCPNDCVPLDGTNQCLCKRDVTVRWACPEGIPQSSAPSDYVVSLEPGEKFNVRPLQPDEDTRKLGKNVKVVKMCLSFDVGLSEPVCGDTHPLMEGDRCYRDVHQSPKVPCDRLLKSHQDKNIIVEEFEFKCKNVDHTWMSADMLDCSCSWIERTAPGFRCPEPFSRADGLGDFYTYEQMHQIREQNPSIFPLRLCHAREYSPHRCFYAMSRKPRSIPGRPHASFGEWESQGHSCARDMWYPPTDPFCINGEDTYVEMAVDGSGARDSCFHREVQEAKGRCSHEDEDNPTHFDESTQTCQHREYAEPAKFSCDHIFNQSLPVMNATPIIRKEVDGETCSVTRFIPAVNICEKDNPCEEQYKVDAEPRCQEGKLIRKGDSAVCVHKTVIKGAKWRSKNK